MLKTFVGLEGLAEAEFIFEPMIISGQPRIADYASAVIGEAALRLAAGTPAMRQAQLKHLIEVAAPPNVTIRSRSQPTVDGFLQTIECCHPAQLGYDPRHRVPPCGSRWTTGWARGTLGNVLSAIEILLVARRHVDFVRVSSAMCRRVT